MSASESGRSGRSGVWGDGPGRRRLTLEAPGAKQRAQIKERTLRTDNWRRTPITIFVVFTAWLLYGLVRAMMGKWYWVEEYHYLTPFYSPCISEKCVPEAADFGRFLPALPFFVPFAAISLPFLLLFRLTCYYYRKAYYRSFWASPPGCAVAEPHARYTGETRFPLLGQNLHRYFFYCAAIISVINTIDAVDAFHGEEGGFGVGLGTLVILANVVLLWCYTLSCH